MTARGELGTAMPAAPSWLAHVQVWGGMPCHSCFDSVSGPHPALLCGGLRHAWLEEEVVLQAAEDAKSISTHKMIVFESGRWN